MTARIFLKIAAAAILVVGLAQPSQADDARLGFSIRVEGDGVLSPVVTKISITKVDPASPAEAAGIVPGDEIIQVDSKPTVGRRCSELQYFLKFDPGETRTLRLMHADGKQFDARLTKSKGG